MPADVSNFDDVFVEYYEKEPYFERAFNIVKSIKESSGRG